MMRSSSSSEVASRGIAKLSPIPSAGAPSRSGYSRSIQVSAKPTAEIAAAIRNTGCSASITAVMYSSNKEIHAGPGELRVQAIGEDRAKQRHPDRAAERAEKHGAGGRHA